MKYIMLIGLCFSFIAEANDIFEDIHYKDNKAIITWLKSDRDINQCNSDGQSILIKAVIKENKWLVAQLLKCKPEINHVDNFGKTALDYAVEQKNAKITRLLLKKGALVTTDYNAVQCSKLVSKWSIWRILGLGVFIMLGLVGIFLGGAIGAMMLHSISVDGVSSCLIPGCSMITIGLTGFIYGLVKLCKSDNNFYIARIEG